MGEGYLSDDQGSDSSDAYRSEAKLEGGSVRSRAIDSGVLLVGSVVGVQLISCR